MNKGKLASYDVKTMLMECCAHASVHEYSQYLRKYAIKTCVHDIEGTTGTSQSALELGAPGFFI